MKSCNIYNRIVEGRKEMKYKDLVKIFIGYGLIVSVFIGSISLIQLPIDVKKINIIEKDIKQAVGQYYQLEDLYLSDWSDLGTHYGLAIDKGNYNGFQSNRVPDIQVIKKD